MSRILPHEGIADSAHQPNSVAKVSYWYLPGGYDVVNARIIECYFSDVDDANRFASRYANPPEMAFVVELKSGTAKASA